MTDATLLQKYADITVVVLRQNYTSMMVYEKLNQRIAQYPAQPVYILLNDTGKAKRYEDKYGYASGYYHDNNHTSAKKKKLIQAVVINAAFVRWRKKRYASTPMLNVIKT